MNVLDGTQLSIPSIYYEVPHVRENPARYLSLQTIKFFVLNLFSLGLFGVHKVLSKDFAIRILEDKKRLMEAEADVINNIWLGLDRDIQTFQGQERVGLESDQLEAIVTNRTQRFSQMDLSRCRQTETTAKLIRSVVFGYAAFIGTLLANYLTLGLYAIYKNYKLNECIDSLVEANRIEATQLNEQLRQKSLVFTSKIDFLRTSQTSIQQLNQLRETEQGVAYFALQHARNQLVSAETERNRLVTDKAQLDDRIVTLTQEQQDLEGQLAAQAAQNEVYNQRIRSINEQIATHDQTVSQLRQTIHTLQPQLNEANRLAYSAREVNKQIAILNEAQERLRPMIEEQNRLGPIKPKYTKLDTDGPLPAGDNAIYCHSQSSSEVVVTAFDHAFEQLLGLASRGENGIVFNKSIHICYESKYHRNKQAVYRYMALDLISKSPLEQTTTGKYILRLNGANVTMGSTEPEYVSTRRYDVATRALIPMVDIVFDPKNVDDFTIQDRHLKLGIDPISVKWILHHLNDEQKKILFTLLMEPVIPDADERLIQAQAFRNQPENREVVKNLETAYHLICDIGLALEKKFNEVLIPCWMENADDDEILPLEKEQPEISLENADLPIVPWELNIDLLTRGGGAGFAEAIRCGQRDMKLVLENISREALVMPSTTAPIAKLETYDGTMSIAKQYHKCHQLISNHGCLFSNLLTILIGDRAHMTSDNISNLKKCMALHLDDPEVGARYAEEILATHNVSLDEYKSWLRTNSTNSARNFDYTNCGMLETRIAAEVIGVRIGIFTQNGPTRLNEHGLLVPAFSDSSYGGPNTEEVLLLYNATNSTYYGLWPRVKDNVLPGDANAARGRLTTFWNSLGAVF